MTAPWHLLPRVLIRAAGFPASWLRALQSPRATAWVRDIREAERRLDALAPELWEARWARRYLARRRPVPVEGSPPAWRDHLAAWNALVRQRQQAHTVAVAHWPAERARLEDELRRLVSAAAVQEAVFTNSPGFLDRLQRFAAGPARHRTRRVALRYLQRFCVKTEASGQSGPLNYGTLDPAAPPLRVRAPGDGRIARRHVLVSFWAAQAIADAWAADPELAGLVRLYRCARRPLAAAPSRARRLLALATGEQPLANIAQRLSMPLPVALAQARELERDGWLRIGLWLPATAGDPLLALRLLVDGSQVTLDQGTLEQGTLEQAAAGKLAHLDELESWRAEFERSDLAARQKLLPLGERLVADLARWPDLEPLRRGGGTFYADRFCYTEEAVGNIDRFVLGGPVVTAIAQALAPALDVLASGAVADRERQRDAVGRLTATGPIPAADLLDLPAPAPDPRDDQWATVVDPNRRVVTLEPTQLAAAGLLRDDLDRWPLFCAPDIMLVADSAAAVARGDFQVVLAETHHICPPTQLPYATFDPDPAGTRAQVRDAVLDLTGTARPVLQGVHRRNKARDYTPAGHQVLWLDWQGHAPGAPGLAVAECEVVDRAGGPVLRAPDGATLALFPEYDDAEPDTGMLRAMALPQLDKQPVRVGSRTPRLTLGRLVFQRERWDLGPDDLPARAGPPDSFDAFLAAWRWKEAWGMPDQVFLRPQSEDKPLFLDFTSPLSVETALRDLRDPDRLAVEEMLPALDQLWLDAGGEPVCVELRLTAFRDGGPPGGGGDPGPEESR